MPTSFWSTNPSATWDGLADIASAIRVPFAAPGNCGVCQHLNNDLDIVTLEPSLIRSLPVELWPSVYRRIDPPADVEQLLLSQLESGS